MTIPNIKPFVAEMNIQNTTQIKPFTYQDWNPDQTISKLHDIRYLVLQYDDNTEYKFIGCYLKSRYPNALRPKWTSKTARISNLLQTGIETQTKWPQIQYLVLQYDDNTEYQYIGRSLTSRYPNPLRPKWTSKIGRISNLLLTRIETSTKRSPNGLKFNI